MSAPLARAPRSVAVLRALMLGDLICATPALRALRQGWPEARITLVGLPWAREWAARQIGIDRFVEFPGWPGLPERDAPDTATRGRFVAAMRRERFDLAIQLHGSGPVVNELVAGFGAARLAGFTSPGAWVPRADAERFVRWPESGSEAARLLALTDHLGLPRQTLRLDFPLLDADRDAAERLAAPLRGRRFAIVHAGAQLPSRRWPPERFAAVADALVARGLAIVLTGTADEAPLTRAVIRGMRTALHPATRVLDLAGRTNLFALGALVEWAALVVCNDTGISHIAAALGTPSVVVASGSDVRRWAPADPLRHRVVWHEVPCRPCAHRECPVGHPCALSVPASNVAVLAQAMVREPAAATPAPV